MAHGTIEEAYEYRLTAIIKGVGAKELGNALMADALRWGGDEKFWFDKVCPDADAEGG